MKKYTRRECLKLGAVGASAALLGRQAIAAAQSASRPLAAAAGGAAGAAGKPRRPNIVFILSDDIGYGDLACYGATKVKTPNLDRLAAAGIRFTDAYAPSAMCTPTRYSVITGRYAWRKPMRGALDGLAPLTIAPGELTLPAMLKKAGYATGAVGKWHLGLGEGETDYNGEIKPGPLEVGFDSFFGYPATNDRVPCVYMQDHRVVGLDAADPIKVSFKAPLDNEPTGKDIPDKLKQRPRPGHDQTIINGLSRIGFMSGGKTARWVDEDMADTLAAKATGFIEQHKAGPFFLYFATHDIHAPHLPNQRFRGTSQCGIRGDCIHELDWTVGQVMATLDRLGIADNTLLIFSSDNGAALRDGYEDGSEEDANGHQCNGPLRGGKYVLYEGGTRVPTMVRWPGKVKPGESGQIVCLVDLLASMAALTGQTLPDDAGPDSLNVLPALLGTAGARGRDHVIEHQGGGGGIAIRRGDWKLIPATRQAVRKAASASADDEDAPAAAPAKAAAKAAIAAATGPTAPSPAVSPAATSSAPGSPPYRVIPPQLYDLADDIGETKNVAEQHPQIVQELSTLMQQIRQAGRSRP